MRDGESHGLEVNAQAAFRRFKQWRMGFGVGVEVGDRKKTAFRRPLHLSRFPTRSTRSRSKARNN